MASRGHTVDGTDGSDFKFRERVRDLYQQIPVLQATVKQLLVGMMGCFAGVCLLALYTYSTFGQLPLSIYYFAASPINAYVGYRAVTVSKGRHTMALIFSTITGLLAAYVLAYGVGPTVTGLTTHGVSPLGAGVLCLHLASIVLHLAAVYNTRSLLELYGVTAKRPANKST